MVGGLPSSATRLVTVGARMPAMHHVRVVVLAALHLAAGRNAASSAMPTNASANTAEAPLRTSKGSKVPEPAQRLQVGPRHTSLLEYGRADGRGPGVVVLHEWWGITDEIKMQAARVAAQGYRVAVPDLYRGQIAQDPAEAARLMDRMDWLGAVEDVRAVARCAIGIYRLHGLFVAQLLTYDMAVVLGKLPPNPPAAAEGQHVAVLGSVWVAHWLSLLLSKSLRLTAACASTACQLVVSSTSEISKPLQAHFATKTHCRTFQIL